MASFKDKNKSEWKMPAFTLGMMQEVREETGVKLISNERSEDARKDAMEWYAQLHDPETLGNVLSIILQDEIVSRKLDARGFARLFDGDAIRAARDALIENLVSFTRNPEVAAAMKADLPAIQKAIDTASIAAWRSIVTNLEESLASTPGHSA